jgi:hypothetical protein
MVEAAERRMMSAAKEPAVDWLQPRLDNPVSM